MNQKEKALADKVSSFYKSVAPTKINQISVDRNISLLDNDVDNFLRVMLCYIADSALFPVFILEGGSLDTKTEIWFIPANGPNMSMKIEKKYLKVFDRD